MSSIEHLQGVFGPGLRWPTADLSREQNASSLRRHEDEFDLREAFTYTVMDPDESECLGCIYINYSKLDTCNAQVIMWVTTDAYNQGLDSILFETVKSWIESAWPFKKVIYPGRGISWAEFNRQLTRQDEKYH